MACGDSGGKFVAVDERLCEARGARTSKNAPRDLERRVIRVPPLHGVPLEIQARELHTVLECDGGVTHRERRGRGTFDLRTAWHGREILPHQRLHLGGLHITRYHDGGVVRRVVLAEEILDVVYGSGREIGHGADHGPGVGVARRVHQFWLVVGHKTVGLVLVGLAPLVLHDVALEIHLWFVHSGEQPSHAISFEPDHEGERRAWAGFVVVRAVFGRGAVVVGSGRLEEPVELRVFGVLRAHEHQVLEEVGEACAPGFFVARADMEPDVGGDDGGRVILMNDEGQPIGEGIEGVGDAELAGGSAAFGISSALRREEGGSAQHGAKQPSKRTDHGVIGDRGPRKLLGNAGVDRASGCSELHRNRLE